MTGKIIDQSFEAIPRKLQDLQRQIDDLRSERRAAATTVTDGDLVVENGGSIQVRGGGAITVDTGVLEALFIFLGTQLRPEGILTRSIAPGDTWQIAVGRIDSTIAGINSTGYPIHLRTDTNDVRVDHTTSSSSANVFIDSTTKRIYRSTSSRRYKRDITDVAIDPTTVLNMRARQWRDRRDVEADETCETHFVGFVAEELDDLGLTEFVVYDDQGRPDAIAYDRLSVALLAVAKDQQTRLERLEQAVAALTPVTSEES